MSIVIETMDFKEKYSLILGMNWLRQHVEKINILHLGIEFASKVNLFECMEEEEWDEATKENTEIGVTIRGAELWLTKGCIGI